MHCRFSSRDATNPTESIQNSLGTLKLTKSNRDSRKHPDTNPLYITIPKYLQALYLLETFIYLQFRFCSALQTAIPQWKQLNWITKLKLQESRK